MNERVVHGWWSWQKALILAVALAMSAFVAGVFWQVESLPEIGLHTTLRNVVNRVDTDLVLDGGREDRRRV